MLGWEAPVRLCSKNFSQRAKNISLRKNEPVVHRADTEAVLKLAGTVKKVLIEGYLETPDWWPIMEKGRFRGEVQIMCS